MMIKVNELAPTFNLFVVELQKKDMIKRETGRSAGTSKLPLTSVLHSDTRAGGPAVAALWRTLSL